MTPTWILETHPEFNAAESLVPFVKSFVWLKPAAKPWDRTWPKVEFPCVAFGTIRTIQALQRFAPLSAAVFDDWAALKCSNYLRYLYDLLGRKTVIVPLKALKQVNLAPLLGETLFVRPDTNDKRMPGVVLTQDQLQSYIANYAPEQGDELVVVSEVVNLGKEYRCFCRDGEVFAHSSYPDEPFEPAPEAVLNFAREVAKRLMGVLPSNMLSVDVAQSSDQIRLVEIGGVNSWGLYGADRQNFVEKMEAEALEVYEESMGQ